MLKLLSTLVFFGVGSCVFAQNTIAPWSDEQSAFAAELGKSFIVPEPEVVEEPAIDPWLQWKTVNNFDFGKNRGDMQMIADLSALHPYFRDKIEELIKICHSKGIEIAVVESYRTVAKQNEYKHMGKAFTRSTGGRSKHQYGLAVDVVPMVDSIAQWHNAALWKKVGAVGEKLGLRWGGRWRRPYDPGHFEWSGGVTSSSMAMGRTPNIPHPEKYPCLEEELETLQAYWSKWEDAQLNTLSAQAPRNGAK